MPGIGNVYPWNIHGALVYMTRNQYLVYYYLTGVFVSGIAICFIIFIILKIINSDDSA